MGQHPVPLTTFGGTMDINRQVNEAEGTNGIDYCADQNAARRIIRREGITVDYFSSAWMARKNGGKPFLGDTELIAAMNCYLAHITPKQG